MRIIININKEDKYSQEYNLKWVSYIMELTFKLNYFNMFTK